MSDFIEKEYASIMSAVTVFSSGAQIERVVMFDLKGACLHIVLAGMEIPFPEYHILL